MIANKPALKKLSLDELVFGALSQLQSLHYHERTIRRYQATWRRLLKFANDNNHKGHLTESLMFAFLEYYNIKPDLTTNNYTDWRKHAEYSLKILWNFARHGCFERCKTFLQNLNISASMRKKLGDYEKYIKEKRHLSLYTVNESVRQIGLFLDFLGKRNINTFNQMKAQDLSDFVYTLSRFKTKTISGIISYVRLFLKFLVLQGSLKTDLSQALPSIRVTKAAKIPSVWDKELITRLLDAVDRSSPKGKRDYAILLLAYRLGLRIKDIRELKLENID